MKTQMGYCALILALGAILPAGYANAGMFDSVTNAVSSATGGGSAPTAESADQLNGELLGLNGRLAGALGEMLQAQSLTSEALGDKTASGQLEAEAKTITGTTDLNKITRALELSTAAAKANQDKMGAAGELSAKAKKALGRAVVHYGKGTLLSASIPAEYTAWGTRAQQAVGVMQGNPMQMASAPALLGQIKDVGAMTTKLPSLGSAWISSTRGFVDFARSNKVSTGDLSSKI